MTDAPIAARPQRARRSMAADAPPVPAPATPSLPSIAPALEPAPVTNGSGVAHDAPAPRVRKPFGSHVQKLAYPQRDGYHRHWFNDTPGRIPRALEAGYTHVKDAEGANVKRIVGVAEVGGGLTAFLMEIPLEWYREDQAFKDARRDEIDAKLRRGVIGENAPGKDGAYLPTNKAGTVGVDVTKR